MLARFGNEFCLIMRAFNFGKKQRGCRKGDVAGDVEVSDLSHALRVKKHSVTIKIEVCVQADNL